MFFSKLLEGASRSPLKETRTQPNWCQELPTSLSSTIQLQNTCPVSNQLFALLHENNPLDHRQSGFKAGHSTEMALLAVREILHTATTASLSSAVIRLGLSAAYDTVTHQILQSPPSKNWVSQALHSPWSHPISRVALWPNQNPPLAPHHSAYPSVWCVHALGVGHTHKFHWKNRTECLANKSARCCISNKREPHIRK